MLKKARVFLSNKHDVFYKIALVLLCISSIVYVFPKEGKFKYEYQISKPWLHEDLIAPFDFAINKTDTEIGEEEKAVIKGSKSYFKIDPKIFVEIVNKFDGIFNTEALKQGIDNKSKNYKTTRDFTLNFLKDIYANGIIQSSDIVEKKDSSTTIYIINNNLAEEANLNDVYTIQTAFVFLQQNLKQNPTVNSLLVNNVVENLLKHNIFFDPVATTRAQKEMLENISLSRDMKQRGERIISRGDLVDDEKFKILESFKGEYIIQVVGAANFYFIKAGQFLLVTLAVLLVVVFLYLFRKDIIEDSRKITFVLLILFLTAAMASIAIRFKITSIYLLPFCIFPFLVRSFFDTRVALFVHLSSTLLIGLIAPNPFEFVFIQTVTCFFAVFSIIDMHHRSQLFFTVTIVFVTYLLSFIGVSVIQDGSISKIDWTNVQWFGISAILVLFVLPLIFVFEKLFGFVSEVSLMELSGINSDLLRELALKAPGTFQHSLQVANLAEEAIIAIGGSSLLVRTGALYHDIGKMEMPMYFIENQSSGVNPHNELSFEESAAIITGHVNKGIEIAKKNNLPDQLIDFIRTHHGTTKAQYFYQSFLKNFPDEEIDVSVFQYPGPIPFSKETAVLMMADSVEAASRSLKIYDAESLEKLVDRVIDSQIAQGQFSNADITFKNITTIKKIFKKKLQNIYHLRIEYPQ
jgi:hypothetical protein